MTRDILSFANFATVAQSNCVEHKLDLDVTTCFKPHLSPATLTLRPADSEGMSRLTRVGKKAVNEKKEILPAAWRGPMKEKCV